MSGLGQWLLQDKQKDLFEYLFAVVVNVVFLALAALVLWALGSAALAWKLAKGYGVFWIALLATVMFTIASQQVFRIDIDSNSIAILHTIGLLSCCVAHTAISAFYRGTIYRLANLVILLVGYIVFSIWPAAGHAIYG